MPGIICKGCLRYRPFDLVAGAEGLEPSTYGLEGRCSIQLSYTPVVPVSTCAGTFRLLVFPGATDEARVYPQRLHAVYSAVAVPCPAVYTHPMKPLDTDKPAQIRQEAADGVVRAQREYRRARYTLITLIVLVVAAVAVTVVALGIR